MIRTRLTIWNCTVLAFILTLTGIAVYFITRQSIFKSMDDNLSQRAKFFAVAWRGRPKLPGGSQGDQNQMRPPPIEQTINADDARREGIDPKQIKQIEVMRNALMPMVLDLDAKDILRPKNRAWDMAGFNGAKSGRETFGYTTQNGVKLRVFSFPLRADGKVQQIIQLVSPMVAEEQQLSELAKTLLIILPLAVIVMLMVGVALTRLALRPIAHIAAAAEQIEASNLSDRLPVLGKDEFAQMSATFNGMLERLKTAFDKIDEAYNRQRRFTADASHELRTPLTTIQARTGIALRRDIDGAKYKEHMQAIDRAACTMNSIVSDLLLLASSDEGQLALRPEKVRVIDLVEDAVSSVDSSKHTFKLDVPEDLEITVDALAITRVLVNLVQNAVLYTEPGKTIFVGARREGRSSKIEVIDHGDGIPAEDVSMIFERFHRVDKSRDRHSGGSGLGLAIAKAIVEAHRGTISLESIVNQGTTVTIWLPD